MSIVTFYNCAPEDAPKPNMPAHLGSNILISCQGKLLLEKRSDSGIWGLIGGGVKRWETGAQAACREIFEEIGLRIPEESLTKMEVLDNHGRIAAFQDGSVWRMVIVVYSLQLAEVPDLRQSSESEELRFFSAEEVRQLQIAVTHRDIIEKWFLDKTEK